MSSRERAILEAPYLSPEKFDLLERYQITENLLTLRPNILQELLEKCTSVRVDPTKQQGKDKGKRHLTVVTL